MPSDLRSGRRISILFALVSAAGYGLNIVTAQMAAGAGVSGALLVFYRVLLMLAAVLALAAFLRSSLRVAPGERGSIVLVGLSSAVVGTAYLSSVAFLPVSVAAVIFYLFPVLIVLAEPWVDRRRFRPAGLAIAALAFAGVALVVGPQISALDPRGLALALLAAAGAAVQFFAASRLKETGELPKLLWVHLIVLPAVVGTLAAIGGLKPPSALAAAPWAVSVTLTAYLAALPLQFMALRRISASAAGLTYCAEPLFAAAFAALILGERLGGVQYAGAAMVLAAIALNAALLTRRP